MRPKKNKELLLSSFDLDILKAARDLWKYVSSGVKDIVERLPKYQPEEVLLHVKMLIKKDLLEYGSSLRTSHLTKKGQEALSARDTVDGSYQSFKEYKEKNNIDQNKTVFR